ncbi:UDP-4-amino-4,6-dideoxy-N-acetyl-beta-L-altrosamine transaminase [soil metagenome]
MSAAARPVSDSTTQARAEPQPSFLPYARQLIEADDVAAVTAALTSELLAQGPRVAAFEAAVARTVGAAHGVACSSGTTALQLALMALNVGAGDRVIAPSLTFLSTATAARLCGAEMVFADVDPLTGLMTADTLSQALARADGPVRGALPVHLGGRMADMPALAGVANAAGTVLIEDGAHALGSSDPTAGAAGACRFSVAATFSFHPVKTIACGEGGMVTTNDPALASRMARLRNHGVTREAGLVLDPALSLDAAGEANPWSYEQLELGLNARMTDLEAALGLSQLKKLDRFAARRRALSGAYDRLLAPLAPLVTPVAAPAAQTPCPHLHQVLIDFDGAGLSRAEVMRRLAAQGIGTQVHYIPVHRQPYFVGRYGVQSLPGADAFYARTLSLPLFPAMDDADPARVAAALIGALGG